MVACYDANNDCPFENSSPQSSPLTAPSTQLILQKQSQIELQKLLPLYV